MTHLRRRLRRRRRQGVQTTTIETVHSAKLGVAFRGSPGQQQLGYYHEMTNELTYLTIRFGNMSLCIAYVC